MIDRDIVLVLLGAALTLVCSITIAVVGHYLSLRMDAVKRQRAEEHKRTEELRDTLEEGAKAYCFKCKQKVDLLNPKEVVLKSGCRAIEGNCALCGAKVIRISKW